MTVIPRVLSDRLEYCAYLAAGMIFRTLGLQLASTLSGTLWRRLAPFSRRHARALAHVAMSLPEKGSAEREAIVRGMWENLGRTFAEAFFLREIAEGGRMTCDDRRALDAWLAWPGGKVAYSAHLANWDVAVAAALPEDIAL